MSAGTLDSGQSELVFAYRTLTLFGMLSHTFRLTISDLIPVRTPKVFLLLVWPPPLSLATTRGISVDFFSSGYLDVSVPGFPSCTYVFSTGSMILHHRGFPIRISPDRSLFAAPRGFSQLVTSFFGS